MRDSFPHAQMAESLPPRLVALLEKLRTLEITAIVPAPPATNGTAATLDEPTAKFREIGVKAVTEPP